MKIRVLGRAFAVVTIAALGLVGGAAPAGAVERSAAGSGAKGVKGVTDVTVDPATAAALQSLGIAPSPIAPGTAAVRDGKLVASFPIVGDPSDGTIEHRGGLKLTKGHRFVTLTDFRIDLNRGFVSAKLYDLVRVPVFRIGAPTADGVTLTLTPIAAYALNIVFRTTAFKPGLVFGYGNPQLAS